MVGASECLKTESHVYSLTSTLPPTSAMHTNQHGSYHSPSALFVGLLLVTRSNMAKKSPESPNPWKIPRG